MQKIHDNVIEPKTLSHYTVCPKRYSYEQTWQKKPAKIEDKEWLKKIALMISRHITYKEGKIVETPLINFLRNFRQELLNKVEKSA